MAKKKLRVGILFGGKSGEHEISLRSAASILDAIDHKKYDVVPLGITKQGKWLHAAAAEKLLCGNLTNVIGAKQSSQAMTIHSAAAGTQASDDEADVLCRRLADDAACDAVA
jgi:D-alanine-D-alanine ligase